MSTAFRRKASGYQHSGSIMIQIKNSLSWKVISYCCFFPKYKFILTVLNKFEFIIPVISFRLLTQVKVHLLVPDYMSNFIWTFIIDDIFGRTCTDNLLLLQSSMSLGKYFCINSIKEVWVYYSNNFLYIN